MQTNITLSKKEKQHYFLYLLGMLFIAVLLLSIILFSSFSSPFGNSSQKETEKLTLESKAEFDRNQKVIQPTIDSTFIKIDKLKTEDIVNEKPEIESSINEVANFFVMKNSTDPRSYSYKQIANFLKMYIEDKEIARDRSENIAYFNKIYEDCAIGIKEKQNQIFQRDQEILNRAKNKKK